MALISWDDQDNKDKLDQFGNPISPVVSVQDGSWQPAPSGANTAVATDDSATPKVNNGIFDQQSAQLSAQPAQGNYLLSDEKAQVDEQKRQQDIEAENARRQQAAAAQAYAQSQAFQQGQVKNAKGQPIDVKAAQQDTGWKKYYDSEFKKEKAGLDFWGRLMDGGQASRRAEINARNKYNADLIRQAYDANGNTVDPNAAARAGNLTAYGTALANDNITKGQVAGRMIGATADNQRAGFWNRIKDSVNAEKQMSVYDALFGVNNGQKTEGNDVGRFIGNLLQGVGTMPTIGAKELVEAGTGTGTNTQTGFEGKLSAGERFGRGVSGALNTVTPFVGGSGKLLDSLTTKVMTGTATAAETGMLKQLTARLLMPALEQGGIGAAQSGAEYFGNGNSLLDKNGNFDKQKLLDFTKQVGMAGGMGVAGGLVMGGGAMGVNHLRGRGIPTLDAGELADLETPVTNSAEAQASNTRAANTEGAATRTLENGEVVPAREPVADGVVLPDNVTPVKDSAMPPERPVNTSIPARTPDLLQPTEAPRVAPVADGIPTAVEPSPAVTTPADVPIKPIKPAVETPIAKGADVTPVADGVVQSGEPVPVTDKNMPVVKSEQVRQLKEAKAGKSQADEAQINQQIQAAEQATPAETEKLGEVTPAKASESPPPVDNPTPATKSSVPDGMGVETPPAEGKPAKTPEQTAQHELIDRSISVLDEPKEYINQVAQAISEPGKSPIKADDMRETLDMYGDKGNAALKDRIATKYERLKEITNEMNKPQLENRKNLKEGGMALADTSITKSRSELQIERSRLEKDLGGDIKKLTAQTSGKARAAMIYNNLKNYRKSNMLLGASNIERQAPQDILGLLTDVVKNPVKMGKALSSFPKEYVKSLHNAAHEWTATPKTISEVPKYILGNAYESAMSLVGVEGAVRARTNAYRNVEARNILTKLGYDVTKENIDRMSKMMGNEAELMAHTAAGVANFMTSNTQFKKASDAYNAYLDGNPLERTKFLENVAKQSTVAAQIKQQLFKSDNPMAHIAAEAIDFISPFVRTASNAFDTTVTQTLWPFSKTAADYILKSNRSTGRNALATLQNTAMDGAMVAGVVGLIGAGKIVYNNGDDVDKPNGLSIEAGGNNYIPIRATHVELAVATIYVAMQAMKDINNGDFKASSIKDYMGILDNSLPYIDSLANTNSAAGSLFSSPGDVNNDNKYKATSYGLNTVKSFVPASNNGIQPWMARNEGKSFDVRSTYDKNPAKWLGNTLNNSYGRGGYLPVSRDAAGRARTSDSQGAFINKTINDMDTKEFNSRINDLVTYGKKNGYGGSTQELFNSYPTDKNNNFKSVQDAITFLDAPTMNGKSTPDNSKKLEKNGKLTDLSKQMYDGFYGDTGSELLTLDGQNLKSDASVPNKDGSKNSHLPISMQSIKNSIAQTDLDKEDSDKLYALSGQSTDLYNQLKAKSITYDQYSAAKADLGKQQSAILTKSKNYQKMAQLFSKLDQTGFFKPDGLGSTKSGQTYLWNALNALLAAKGATPAAEYPDPAKKGFTPWGNGGTGRSATNKPGDRGNTGIKWTPVQKRQMASVAAAKYTPVKISVSLGNAIKKDKTQNYANRSF